ncbi:MAG: GNAT family N-acetyltransferase [Ideonella sp.]|nr:GNAT family N-acetyltransferase [Ideonella sp.]
MARPRRPGGLPALHALYRDPEVRRYFPDGTRTLDEPREELEWFLNGHPRHPELGLWATVEKASGAFLGRCGLLSWTIEGRLEVELAFLIDKTRWGEGLATEASLGIVEHARATLGLSRLVCLIMPGNERSRDRLLRRDTAKGELQHEQSRSDEGGMAIFLLNSHCPLGSNDVRVLSNSSASTRKSWHLLGAIKGSSGFHFDVPVVIPPHSCARRHDRCELSI